MAAWSQGPPVGGPGTSRVEGEAADRAAVVGDDDEVALAEHRRQPQCGSERRQAVFEGLAGLGRAEHLVEVVIGALEQQQHHEARKGGIGQPVERPGLGEARPAVGVQVGQAGPGPSAAREIFAADAASSQVRRGRSLRLEVAAELRADEDVDGLARRGLDLAGGEAHDAVGVEEDQDARDRRQQMGVDPEDVRP